MTREEAINELFWIREDENDLKGKEALNMAIKALEQTEPERKGREEFEDLKDFVSDIIAINNNYNNAEAYYPEDLEVDFDYVMEKWSKKIEYYKWGKKNDNTCN